MYNPLAVIALVLALLCPPPAHAAPVLTMQAVGPSAIGVGGIASFELVLLNPDAVIGAFSVDIAFNPAVLQFLPAASLDAQLGTGLGQPGLFEAIGTAGESAPGVLHIDEVSLLDSASLVALQGGGVPLPSLLLATLSFQAMAPGLGGFELLLASVQFSDAAGVALPLPTLQQPGAVQVLAEPTSAALVLLALAACGSGWRPSRIRVRASCAPL